MSDMWKPASLGINVTAGMLRFKSVRTVKADSEATDGRHARSDKTFTTIVTITDFFLLTWI